MAQVIKLRARTAEQRQFLRSATGARRWGYNRGLAIWNEMEKRARALPPKSDERKEAWPNEDKVRKALADLVATHPDLDWARALDSRIFQEAVADLANGKKRHRNEMKRVAAVRASGGRTKFDKKCKAPRFKRKGRDPDRYRTTNDRVEFRRRNGTFQVRLAKVGWIDLAEEPMRHGKLMSLTIRRHGEDFYLSLTFQRDGVQAKRTAAKATKEPKPRKTPVHPRAEESLRLPVQVKPRRRSLTPVKDVAQLIAEATLDDVVGGDRGQRVFLTLSRPVTMTRSATAAPLLSDARVVGAAPIAKVEREKPQQTAPAKPVHAKQVEANPTRPKIGHRKPKSKLNPRKAARTKAEQVFTQQTEVGQEFTAPKPLRKALRKLRRLQRDFSHAALIPLPVPVVGPPTAEKAERKAHRAELRKERTGMSRKGRMTLRAKVKQRSADDRAKRRAATKARRKVEHLERCRIGKERKELRASGREDEAKALHRPRRKARKSVRGSRLVSKISSQHADVVHMRDDVQHKITTVVTRQIKVLCLDHVPGNGGFGASDAALGKMRAMFGYKGALDGCLIIDAWQFFPSSKRCSVCGHIHADLKRGDGMWVCSECDTRHGRDINAAQNLEWYGRIALAIRKGGDAADSALSGLTDVERSWFMSDFADAKRQVGQARAELTRGETTRAPIGCRPSRSRERVGDQLCSLP